jgi:hypothetical protein
MLALKMLGWVEPHHEHSNVLIATAAAAPALDQQPWLMIAGR